MRLAKGSVPGVGTWVTNRIGVCRAPVATAFVGGVDRVDAVGAVACASAAVSPARAETGSTSLPHEARSRIEAISRPVVAACRWGVECWRMRGFRREEVVSCRSILSAAPMMGSRRCIAPLVSAHDGMPPACRARSLEGRQAPGRDGNHAFLRDDPRCAVIDQSVVDQTIVDQAVINAVFIDPAFIAPVVVRSTFACMTWS